MRSPASARVVRERMRPGLGRARPSHAATPSSADEADAGSELRDEKLDLRGRGAGVQVSEGGKLDVQLTADLREALHG
jgi:hypothetical protein